MSAARWLAWSEEINQHIERLTQESRTTMATAAETQIAIDALKPVVAQAVTLLNSIPGRIKAAQDDAVALDTIVADSKKMAADLTTANAAVPVS